MEPHSAERKKMVIPSTNDGVRSACRRLIGEVKDGNFTEEEVFAIHLALEEAVVNAAEHGNGMDPDKEVTIEWSIGREKFEIDICDCGRGFKPDEVPDPRCDENLEKPSGRGVLLMRAYMDVVEFNNWGNCVHMEKHRKGKEE
ncbi:anti-sigma F factor [Anaerohalosphaera lusitana]|uniref:Anti-sigma F factor n=1 Tax=Anaerohalosphaera lusitana TaxID=1936003 RepID=A0A1U9NNW9_9BACT|nr:ATP-binding protein [Anaerohalosphaera lusitana]AQT69310.1 anti-sigma F factor [Anaerohalosphaera lusitana]